MACFEHKSLVQLQSLQECKWGKMRSCFDRVSIPRVDGDEMFRCFCLDAAALLHNRVKGDRDVLESHKASAV